MDEIRIDQLSLKLTGLSEQDGQRLVRLITDGLAAADLPSGPATIGAVRIGVTGDHTSVEALSQHVVAEVLRQLQRTV